MISVRGTLGVVFFALAIGAAGCGHTHSVQPDEKATEKSDHEKHEKKEKGEKSDHETAKPSEPKRTTANEGPGADIPVASSPEALLEPGAAKRIQEKLANAGRLDRSEVTGTMNPATRTALRHFQDTSGLAATGIPDEETIRKLGLDPKDVFRAKE